MMMVVEFVLCVVVVLVVVVVVEVEKVWYCWVVGCCVDVLLVGVVLEC